MATSRASNRAKLCTKAFSATPLRFVRESRDFGPAEESCAHRNSVQLDADNFRFFKRTIGRYDGPQSLSARKARSHKKKAAEVRASTARYGLQPRLRQPQARLAIWLKWLRAWEPVVNSLCDSYASHCTKNPCDRQPFSRPPNRREASHGYEAGIHPLHLEGAAVVPVLVPLEAPEVSVTDWRGLLAADIGGGLSSAR
jgi:hypothetical protein